MRLVDLVELFLVRKLPLQGGVAEGRGRDPTSRTVGGNTGGGIDGILCIGQISSGRTTSRHTTYRRGRYVVIVRVAQPIRIAGPGIDLTIRTCDRAKRRHQSTPLSIVNSMESTWKFVLSQWSISNACLYAAPNLLNLLRSVARLIGLGEDQVW